MKRTVDIEDTLQDRISNATEAVADLLERYRKDNRDINDAPDLDRLDRSGDVHQIVESSVPVYTREINDLFYLHGDRLEAAFDDAGCGEKRDDKWPNGWRAVAVYFFIEQAVNEWYGRHAAEAWSKLCEKYPEPVEADAN